MRYSSFCIPGYLEKAAFKYKDKTLYNDASRTVSFGDANSLSDRIGTFLLEKGISKKPVIVLTGRNVMTPVCFFGVLKAACYYVPVDHTVPSTRIDQILSFSGAEFMIIDSETEELASKLSFSGTVFRAEEMMAKAPSEELLSAAWKGLSEDWPAYIIFTSGSTGKPKGVVTSHRSLICYIESVCRVLRLEESDVLGNQSPLDYIAAIRDIYLPLFSGCSTVILSRNSFAIPTGLFGLLNEYHISVICWSVSGVELPAKLRAFEAAKPLYLKTVIFFGSVINPRYLRVWQDNLPGVRFINQYGPTEATASCTYYEITEPVEPGSVIPIGVPYGNYTIYLIKEDGKEAQPGEQGEICVAGPCLALGYYQNPAATEAAFVQNPLNKSFRELIYRTGDIGRLNEKGQLEFLGRKDRQIKHMGHRIELEEIEAAARAVEGVLEVYAAYYREKELLYLFYTGSAAPKDITLSFRKYMPAFMVPRRIVQLESFPALPNGKTDGQALNKMMYQEEK